MKTYITKSTNISQTYTRLLGVILTVILLATSFAMSIPTLDLRSADNFAVLAGSAITGIAPVSITGDLGLSPSTGSSITGFDASKVSGILYVVDAGGPVGSVIDAALLLTAKNDLTTAYNDAAGRTPIPTGTYLNPGAGNIGGMTLVPGLYKFTSSALISGSDVTLSGSATDVWIFQIGSSLTVGTGIKVILSGGAKASNVFWQVGSSATLGTSSDFKGTILASQSITFVTSSIIEGRALAITAAVTMGSAVVVKLPTTTIQASLLLSSPVGNENFCAGSNHNITWSSAGIANVKIEISANGGASYSTLASSVTASAGSYTWGVPSNQTVGSSYKIRVSDLLNSMTNSVGGNFTVPAPVAITTQPLEKTVSSGLSVSFNVSATGVGLSYQWKKNSVNISGATLATYYISSASTSNAGNYTVVATGTCGSVTSNSVLLTVNPSPEITTQPLTQSIAPGSNVSFSVVSTGEFLTYQWKKDLVDINSATNSTYDINTVNSDDAGAYSVAVQSNYGSVASNAADLTINNSIAVLDLKSTADFAILAGSAVTGIAPVSITGDLGLSPSTGSSITGFDASRVSGVLYVVDAGGPAGSVIDAALLLTAKNDLTTAYNDAAGRTPIPTGTFLNPGAGNIGGMTLAAGLYKFTSSAAITGSDVTLSGSATDVWIFQIGTALTVGVNIKVILAGGAQASNIFWQVGSSATLNTYSVFKGTIMADQSISFGTGATIDGRALASVAAVTMGSAVVVKLPVALPGISLTSPAGGENWGNNKTHNISWISTNVTNVKIELSANGGLNYTTLVASTLASTGSYSWTIPSNQTAGTTYKVRISDVSNSATNDVSANFTISLNGYKMSGGREISQNTFSVYPNPASDYITVSYTLASVQNIDVKIVDILGKTVLTSNKENSQPGSAVINLNTTDVNGMQIPNGHYTVLISSNRNTMSYPLIINR